ncbi:hypothetical protein JQ631_32125 [Bradyrhizobium manausense]|uniref:hypothetical protein n=1 Tax=Bradyrhizobium manausense TaxID=989370 RepID=UPI001BA708D2|nr:hypothetical protein [Bradyrhizobium manausense]MBR0793753.1 hypothetical protein [Bradyrhizobium manausense]
MGSSAISPETIKKLLGSSDDAKKRLTEDMQFVTKSLKDVQDGKEPPAHSETLNLFIAKIESFAADVRSATFWRPIVRGDSSGEAQMDCARYLGVLDAAQKYYEEAEATERDLPQLTAIIPDLKALAEQLNKAAADADALMKIYAGLAQNPSTAVREFFGWLTFDMIKVSKALATASSEVKAKAEKCEKYVAQFPQATIRAKEWVDNYRARIPKMREFCDKHRAEVPQTIMASVRESADVVFPV